MKGPYLRQPARFPSQYEGRRKGRKFLLFPIQRIDQDLVFLLDDGPPHLERRRDLARFDLEVAVEEGEPLHTLVRG